MRKKKKRLFVLLLVMALVVCQINMTSGKAMEQEQSTTEVATEEASTETVTEAVTEEISTETVSEESVSEEEESTVELDEYKAYKVTKHLLSDGYNYTTDDGLKVYSNIKDSDVTVESIKAKGGKYAKCKAETKKKGEIDKDHYYKLTYENAVGDFLTSGFYDNKGQHHGAVHLVEKFYKKYQVYSQVYSYTVTDEDAQTKDYYYFVYIWRELVDEDYHATSEDDILTYCIEYGAALSNTTDSYATQKTTYDKLEEPEQHKIALAIYYGPHKAADEVYYSTKETPVSGSIKAYDPATWNETFYKRYVATQLYIWSVQAGDAFNIGDAKATAKLIDSKYAKQSGDKKTYCYDFLLKLINYVNNATGVPSFTKPADKTPKSYVLQQKGATYTRYITDKNGLCNEGTWSCDNENVTITPSTDGTGITITSTQAIDEATITFTRNDKVPTSILREDAQFFYSSGKAQDMVRGYAEPHDYTSYMKLYTKTLEGGTITITKEDSYTKAVLEGAAFAVFTTSKKAAIYNPDTNTDMTDLNGNKLDASDYIAGIRLWDGNKIVPYTAEAYAAYQTSTNNRCSILYNLAYYQNYGAPALVNGAFTNQLTSSCYTIHCDETGEATTGELLNYYTTGSGDDMTETWCKYYLLEIDAPPKYELLYPVSIQNGCWNGTLCVNVTDADWKDTDGTAKHFVYKNVANTAVAGMCVITKRDETTWEPLANVVFNVYTDSSCTNLFRTVTTDANGEAWVYDMPIEDGTYYICEATGQSGYMENGGITEVIIEPGETTEVEIFNKPWSVNISINKELDKSSVPEGQDASKYSLEGAKFGLYAADIIYGANAKVLYQKDQLILELITDAEGKAKIANAEWCKEHLRLGKYYVKELEAPNGFVLNTQTYNIDATDPSDTGVDEEEPDVSEYSMGTVLYRNVVVKETLEQTPIMIHKTIDNGLTDFEGAAFSVYDLELMKKDGITIDDVTAVDFKREFFNKYRCVINPTGNDKFTVITDKDGKAKTSNLMNGQYVVVEVAAPYGYDLAPNQMVTLPDEAGKDIVLSFNDEQLNGCIQVMKLGDAPIGYTPVETKYGTWNRLEFGKLPLAGVVFTIYATDGTAVGTITTNAEGYAQSETLPVGKYTVKETSTPAGLIQSDAVYEVEIKAEGQTVINPTLEVNNDVMTAQLAVYKVGETINAASEGAFGFGQIPLEGVVYGVFNAEPLLNNQGQVILPAGSCVSLAKTSSAGEAVMENCLVPGQYYYKELATLDGYVLDEENHYFTLELGTNKTIERVELNKESPVLNKFYKAQIELIKMDADNGEIKLQGAVFGLFDSKTGRQIAEYTTDKDGKIFISDMPYGSWYFKELKAPKGYILNDEPYDFCIHEGNAGQVIQIEATNHSTPKLGFDDGGIYYHYAFAGLGIILITAGAIFMLRKRKSCKKER